MSARLPLPNDEGAAPLFLKCFVCKSKGIETVSPIKLPPRDQSLSRTCRAVPMEVGSRSPLAGSTTQTRPSDAPRIRERTESPLYLTFNFRTSRITVSKLLYAHLLADQTNYIEFLSSGRLCFVTRGEPGKGVRCTVDRSARIHHKAFVEDRRLAWECGKIEKLRVEVARVATSIPGLDASAYPDPAYQLLI